jgi:hypothetical protein
LELSPALGIEHQSLHKKKGKTTYTSSAQITTQHSKQELDGAAMLTLINFPRKQIGRTMSDCLTTGALPADPGVSEEEKRAKTVYVTPFLGGAARAEKLATPEPGSKVGVLGEEGLVETNPRDLSWAEFMSIKLLVGKVLSVGAGAPQLESGPTAPSADKPDATQPIPIPLTVDFGTAEGHKEALVYLRPGYISPEEVVGRQVLAVINLAPTIPTDGEEGASGAAAESKALVFTVGGKTTVEPAKEVENGFRLA